MSFKGNTWSLVFSYLFFTVKQFSSPSSSFNKPIVHSVNAGPKFCCPNVSEKNKKVFMSQIFLQNQCTILDNSRYIFLVIWVIAEIYVFIGAIIFFLVTYHFFLSFEKKLLLFLLLSLESLRLVPWTGAKLPSASVIYKERKWKQPIMTLVSFSKALTHNCFLKSLEGRVWICCA